MTLACTAAVLLILTAPAAAPAGDAPPPAAEVRPPARRYVVERIAIQGVLRTRESQIRRHLQIAEGDLLDNDRVLLSRLRLLQLGWFSSVETRVERGSERGRVVLVFTVVERNTILVSDLIIGSTDPQPLYGGLGLSQQNFLGRGLGLSGAFVYGGSPLERPEDPARFALRGAFFAPDLRVRRLMPLVFGVTGLWVRGEELTCADADCSAFDDNFGSAPRLRYSRLGGEISLGVRPGPFERLIAGWRAERITSHRFAGDAAPAQIAPDAPFVLEGGSWLTALTGTYDRDTRNDVFFPTAGTRLLGHVTFASSVFGGDYEYSRFFLQLESAFAIPRRHALRLLAAAGAVQGDAPFFDRFYPADWAYFTLGPALGRALELNFSTDARYDGLLLMGGAEWGIPLWTTDRFFRRGYVAVGARALWTGQRGRAGRTTASSTPFSADLALRVDTPIGLFNLSLGYALDNFL